MRDVNRYEGYVTSPDTNNVDTRGVGGKRNVGERQRATY